MRRRVQKPRVRKTLRAATILSSSTAGDSLRATPGTLVPLTGSDRAKGATVPEKGDVFPQMDRFHPEFNGEATAESTVLEPNGSLVKAKKMQLGSSEVDWFLGKTLGECGDKLLQRVLEVLPLRSKPTGSGGRSLLPLPTSRNHLLEVCPDLCPLSLSWLLCTILSLNSTWGEDIFCDRSPNSGQKVLLAQLAGEVRRITLLGEKAKEVDWLQFFRTRGVDYCGDEVKVAQRFQWQNIAPALPAEIGRVPLQEVCTHGSRFYVEHFDLFLKPRNLWPRLSKPKVMVSDEQWGSVCQGLLQSGICGLMLRDEVFDTGEGLLLNGLFGVSKEEVINGYEVLRLIMNLIPLNGICESLTGDVETLPSWSLATPLFLQPTEDLLISSEDVRCFFYTMSVPEAWMKYLAFNKRVPDSVLPHHLQGEEVYLASKVLPMGFLNSVSLAQHVHRNLATWSGKSCGSNAPEREIRKDLAHAVGSDSWRIYLDNYDLLEKIPKELVGEVQGSQAPGVLALQQEYSLWDVPRNVKKAVSRQPLAEVQGAVVDGELGVAYPKDAKLLKYFVMGLDLCERRVCTLKQLQVVAGGLVYFSMFRRPLLGCLNSLWQMIEAMQAHPHRVFKLWDSCRLEILRFLGLVPLARLDFRLPMHEQITCSDASNTGGGICASSRLTSYGLAVSQGKLRGEIPVQRGEMRVLSVSLFDGIGALRVALDLVGAMVVGHVSVEKNVHATRVVESHFAKVKHYSSVEEIGASEVREWSLLYPQCALVLLGGGPPCQGVSGLNADRKGALRDERSSLFSHVARIRELLRAYFPWAQVYSLMESVASMDQADQDVMSRSKTETFQT